ncbi:MAG: HdeD family acid-resistance protein [Planctomycetes bacterium]|nr:HdeD family acid-resistance protein [Planctomycetota bacterium]
MTMTDLGPGRVLIDAIARNWPLILVRGVAAIVFGILCFVWPAITLLALVLVWGAYAIVDGVGAIVWGTRSRWWSMVAVGIVSVLAGLIAFFWPGITALALLYLIAAWAIVRGGVEIAAAVRLRHWIRNEWLLGLAGIASIVFGVLVALFPGAGAPSVVWLIGVFAVVFGVLAVGVALRLRSLQHTARARPEEVSAAAVAPKWDEDTR